LETIDTAREEDTYGEGQSSAARKASYEELKEQAGVVRDDVRDLARAAGNSAVAQLDPIEEYVREKPLKSLLIAAGVGAVFGLLFLRR